MEGFVSKLSRICPACYLMTGHTAFIFALVFDLSAGDHTPNSNLKNECL